MNKQIFVAITIVCVTMLALTAFADELDVQRSSDGTFSFKIGTVVLNEGSSLEREAVILNDPTCPIQINSASISLSYSREDRNFLYKGTSQIESLKSVQALELRHVLFDVFGQHLKNLSNFKVQDFEAGNSELSGEWRVYPEGDIGKFLSSVTFIVRVRLEDGTQWVADFEKLGTSLSSLELERKIEEKEACASS